MEGENYREVVLKVMPNGDGYRDIVRFGEVILCYNDIF